MADTTPTHIACIRCDKRLWRPYEHEDILDAGTVFELAPGYGSRHDQGGLTSRDFTDADSRLTRLLKCDTIQAALCDDCLEQVAVKTLPDQAQSLLGLKEVVKSGPKFIYTV